MKKLALAVTFILHPLLVPTYGSVLLLFGIRNTVYNYMTPWEMKWRITFIVFLFTFVFPLVNIYLLYRLKRIRSFILSDRAERTSPYITTSIFYFGLFYLLSNGSVWQTIRYLILGGGLAILITALITLKRKISAHMVGLGGLLASL